jgi:hypothetical protein
MKQETLTVLKNFAGINKYIRIDKGNTLVIYNQSIGLFAKAKVEDTFPKTFSIYDLNQLLATISLFNDPEITYNEASLDITSGRMSVKYRYSDSSITIDQPRDEPQGLPEPSFSFELKKELLQEILKASSVLGVKLVELSKDRIRAYNVDAYDKPLDNEYQSLIENATILNEFEAKPVKIKIDALKMLQNDYTVFVSKHAVKFISQDGNLVYISGVVKSRS